MRWSLIIIGALMVLVGGVWTLQGLNVLLGSFMSGSPFWGIVGAVVLILGVVLCFFGVRGSVTGPRL